MEKQSNSSKKLVSSIVAIIALPLCLCITTFALVYSIVSVDNNLFQNGTVKINLNDGMPVIEEHEFLFEPGMTVEKNFFLENQSTWDVYYRLYFENTDGELSDIIDVTIRDDNGAVLYNGKASECTSENIKTSNSVLRLNECKELTITFHFPTDVGNYAQNQYLTFDLKADAVQTKNNHEQIFV